MCAGTSLVLLYLSAFSSMFDAIKHGPKFCQPLAIHCSHTLHVLLQHKAKLTINNTDIIYCYYAGKVNRFYTLVVMTSSW